MIAAHDACKSLQDYEGVAVDPIATHEETPDHRLPWTIQIDKHLAADER